MSVNLTRKQMNALMKGKNVRVKPHQLGSGDVSIFLDGENMKKYNRSLRANKGMVISPSHLHGGASFKSVLDKVKKSAEKTFEKKVKPSAISFYEKEVKPVGRQALKETKMVAKDIFNETVKPMLVEQKNRQVRKARARIEKTVTDNVISEKRAEKILEKLGVDKDLAKDLVTDSKIKLSNAGKSALDRIEDVLTQEVGLNPIADYEISDELPDVDDDMPVAMARAIQEMEPLKGSGAKFVYLKGGKVNIGKVMKKIGKTLGKIGQNKAVRKVLSDLGTKAISAGLTYVTGNPMASEAIAQSVGKPLLNEGIAQGTDALAGMGLRRTRGGAMYMTGMRQRGGAMYGLGSDIRLPVVGKIRQNDGRKYL